MMPAMEPLLTGRPRAEIGADTLSSRVRDVLLERILHGEIEPGARVRIAPLAEELGVSPTPLREALHQLARDGFLELEPHRGFSVTPLTLAEVRSLYPVLATLEDMALASVPPADPDRARELARINDRLLEAIESDPHQAIALNALWHRTLIEPCGNQVLLGLVADLRRRLFRYELVFYRAEPEEVRHCALLHAEILAALRAGRTEAARELLRSHWASDLQQMLPRVKSDAGA